MKSERSTDTLTGINLGIFYCCCPAPSVTLGKAFQFWVFRLTVHLGGQNHCSSAQTPRALSPLVLSVAGFYNEVKVIPRTAYTCENLLA